MASRVILLRSPPSPAMPVAVAVALVPPSQTESAATATPELVRATLAVVAMASEWLCIQPALLMSSLPSPPLIPVDSDFAVDVDTAAATPLGATATLTPGASEPAIVVMSPVLVIVSSPEAYWVSDV